MINKTKKKYHKMQKHSLKKHIKMKKKTKMKIINNKKMSFSLKKVNCSPKTKKNNFTCYSDENLHKMRDIWNKRHPDQLINTNDSREIWELLKEYYTKMCNKESCWIKQLTKDTPMEKELVEDFAPVSPDDWKKNPNEWLTSVDISAVMKQYERAYKCFAFIGPSPIDFDTRKQRGECVWDELCKFNINQYMKQGKTKIGIIFNTDPHYKPGEHWISLFINIKKGKIFFFDSAGSKVPLQIKQFVKKVTYQGKQMNPPIQFTFDQNYPVEHQYKNTECGIYSIFFIVHMLEDKITGEYLKTHILKDEYMEKFRNIYFNKKLF